MGAMWRISLLLLMASPALANREGWANARQKAERMERRGEMAEAAAWWEAAAESLESGSAPLSSLAESEAREDGDQGAQAWWAKYAEEDAALAKEARGRAKACAGKAGTIPDDVRASVRQFLDGWIVQDAENYWKWGRFEIRIASRRGAGDEPGALALEFRARRRWAARYEAICIPYWKGRGDAAKVAEYERRAGEQRALAEDVHARALAAVGEQASARGILKRGSPEERREAARRLAAFRDIEGLLPALEDADEATRDLAARAIAASNDLTALALDPAGAAGKALAPRLQAEQRAASPGFFATRLAGLSHVDPRVRAACAGALAGALGAAPGGTRDAFEAALRARLEPGAAVELAAGGTAAARQSWEDLERDWRLEPPADGLPADGWRMSARAFLDVPADTVAELLVHCDDAVRVRIDGRAVIDEWTEAPEPLFRRAPLKLAKGLHSFELEYEDRSGVAVLRAWLAPGRDEVHPLRPLLRRLP